MGKLYLCIPLLLSNLIYPDYYIRSTPQLIQGSYNSVAQTGLIHLPTAESQPGGTVGITLGNSSINKFLSINASPFDWLEASFYYHRPRDTLFESKVPNYEKVGNYLDKGFNLKFTKQLSNLSIALGIDDIGGTGFFSKEYVVGTFFGKGFNLTLGIGTGKFSGDNSYKNPIPGLEARPNRVSQTENNVGDFDFNVLFKGPVSIFGGLEYAFKDINGLTLKIESNPFDYESFMAGGGTTYKTKFARRKSKDFNIGLSYRFLKHYNLSISQIKGNAYDLRFSRSFNLLNARPKTQITDVKKYSEEVDSKLSFYQDLLRNLERDQIYLQSADLRNQNLEVAIVNNKYDIPQDLFTHVHKVASDISKSKEIKATQIKLTHIVSGFETGNMSALMYHPLNRHKHGKINISEADDITQDHEFKTILKFPEFYYSIKPQFNYRYADPTRFFAGGLDLVFNSEIKFSPSFYTTTNISYQVFNSFKRLRYYPDSPYLPHVRTDVVLYLNNRSDFYLNNLQVDKLIKLKKNHYFKFSSGMFEMMFGGIGAEYVWKPFYKNYYLGINLYKVKQRSFKQQFRFNNYETLTGHLNFIYLHNKSGITLDLSVGQYLAKDRGYTFDISRQFRSGAKIGAYFTRTNISKKTYGEGSFDKGFYFQIPLKFLDDPSNRGGTKFLIQPLTRDGGAKLKTNSPLIYSIYGGSKNEHDFYITN